MRCLTSGRELRLERKANGERDDAPSSPVPSDHGPDVPDRLIAIVGPTAAGKTELAMRLSEHIPVEVIGADSRQVYRYMDIGTAKPSAEDRSMVPHHLVDIINPDDEFSLSEYISCVKQANRIAKTNERVPILVGGTGQYVMATLEGWTVPGIAPDSGPALHDWKMTWQPVDWNTCWMNSAIWTWLHGSPLTERIHGG